jgi:transmembrane sensor
MDRFRQSSNAVDEQARDWAVYLHSDQISPEDIARFREWLARSPSHAEAYRGYEQLMEDVAGLNDVGEIGLCTHEPPPGPIPANDDRPSAPSRIRVLAAVAAAAVLAIGLVFAIADIVLRGPNLVTTPVGEIREIALNDGTRITLGPRSSAEVDYGARGRHVRMISGEAFFDVAPDPARPFTVAAGDRRIEVVGTRFNIRRSGETVRVDVVEGEVRVRPARLAGAEIDAPGEAVLRRGEAVVAEVGAPVMDHKRVEPEAAVGWMRGWLSYEDATLAQIADDLARYDRREIVFTDPELGEYRVTASFGAHDIDRFFSGLAAAHPVSIDRSNPDQVFIVRD